jgi:hypothetical protein
MKTTSRLLLTAFSAALLTQCDRELSPNEKMSQETFMKAMLELRSPAVAAAPASDDAMANPTKQQDKPVSGTENAVLTDAPNVPPPITRDHPTKVTIKLEVVEVVKRMADGVDYTFLDLRWQRAGQIHPHPPE